MRHAATRLMFLALLLAGGMAGTAPAADDPGAAEAEEALSAGSATSIDLPDRNAFRHMRPGLSAEEQMRFHVGRALFRKLWVAAPSSTQASDGLGPLYNARSCETCHARDGRGRPPEPGETGTGFLLRLARNPLTPDGAAPAAPDPDPIYGHQLQDLAIPGLAAEGRVTIRWSDVPVSLADGTVVTLRKPDFAVTDLAGGPLDPRTSLSPRIAPPMIGLGLIEAIPESRIRALADPADADGDGISGRAAVALGGAGSGPDGGRLGRFGWKAQHGTVRQQTLSALAADMGLSTPDLPLPFGDCTPAQTDCLSRPTGEQARLGPGELSGEALEGLVFYSEAIAVPARRKASFPGVLAGKRVFHALGCAACHTPRFTLEATATNPALGGEVIRPYSDFLLHDMGEGLADGQQVGIASGTEWRTPPLWGIGLTATVNGNGVYLHDGRARSLEEAILWHGGEAQAAHDAYRTSSAGDRQALIHFLESL